MCTHAGLEICKPAAAQIDALKARDLTSPMLHERGDLGRIAPFSGRNGVLPMHPDLEGKAVLVSGHHGYNAISGDRIVLDLSGGVPSLQRPLQAIVLPERTILPRPQPIKHQLKNDTIHELHQQLHQLKNM